MYINVHILWRHLTDKQRLVYNNNYIEYKVKWIKYNVPFLLSKNKCIVYIQCALTY